jgi:endonuclease III
MEDRTRQLQQHALTIYDRLLDAYGYPTWRPHLDPVSEIVSTILSQNTTDINRDRAFDSLKERYPTWEEVRHAPLAEIEDAIRSAGMARQRAPRITHALTHIVETRGELSLDFLKEMPIDEAKAWLTAIPGIGPKTAAIVLLFSLGIPAFPVDTHVHRVTLRLGLAPARTTAPKTQELLEDLLPEDIYYPFHINLITHGRRVCKAQRPLCDECFLADLCRYRQTALAEEA